MYYLGLDLGQAADYSALSLIEEPIYVPQQGGWVSSSALEPELSELYQALGYRWAQQAPGPPPLWLKLLHRYPLRTPYPDIVADVVRRLGTKPRSDAVLVVDGTGVGAPVVDMFRYSALPCELKAIIIHGGVKVIHDRGTHVPKRDLIGALQVAIQTRRLQPSQHTKEIETFLNEMQGYAVKISDAGNDTYSPRGDSQHDDLVLSVSLPVWLRLYRNRGA